MKYLQNSARRLARAHRGAANRPAQSLAQSLARALARALALALPICIGVIGIGGGSASASEAQAKASDPLAIMRARGCIACHVIPGIPEARGTMGPTLKGLSKRKRIVARTLTNNDKNLRRWLKDPKGVKSDTMMPNVGLTDDEIETLIAHFQSL